MSACPKEDLQACLRPTRFVDSDSPDITAFAAEITAGASSEHEKAVRLYYAVRDRIEYDPYGISVDPADLAGTAVLRRGRGHCIGKAILLAAVARAEGIPSMLGFADVRNHLMTGRFRKLIRTDVLRYHGYALLYLDASWVKVTPTFNLSLCEKFGVHPLEFDGSSDALFHEFDVSGQRHMEYLLDYGGFADLPFKMLAREMPRLYPMLIKGAGEGSSGDFAAELAAERYAESAG